jgi:NADPH:quinone reductase-like Zn-dependent oxidoreductase
MDVAGRVLELGEAVTTFRRGDRVCAELPLMVNGSYAERSFGRAEWFAQIPDGVDWVTAGALPTPASTGIQLIEDGLAVSGGQRILITGATGFVGLIACYVAKQRGAHVTAAVRQKYCGQVRYADDTIAVDGGGLPTAHQFDMIADTVGGEVAHRLLATLKPGGVLSTVATTPIGEVGLLDVEVRHFGNKPDAFRLNRLAKDVESGALQLPPIRTMKMSEAAEAHRQMETGGAGKIVLIPDHLWK